METQIVLGTWDLTGVVVGDYTFLNGTNTDEWTLKRFVYEISARDWESENGVKPCDPMVTGVARWDPGCHLQVGVYFRSHSESPGPLNRIPHCHYHRTYNHPALLGLCLSVSASVPFYISCADSEMSNNFVLKEKRPHFNFFFFKDFFLFQRLRSKF